MFIAAIATMVLAGCTKDESIVEQQEIGFQPLAYKASQTKAETTGDETGSTTTNQQTTDNVITDAFYPVNGPTFGLFAYQLEGVEEGTFDAANASANLYIYNKPVKYTAGNWRTDPKSFWPLQGSLTFIAYSPFGVSASHSINKVAKNEGTTKLSSVLTITDFQADTEGQKDLMWSNLSKDKTSNGTVNNYPEESSTYAGVPITFNHALCRIKITAKTAENYSGFATYKIKKIEVANLKDNATLTVTDDKATWSDPTTALGTASGNDNVFDFFAPDAEANYVTLNSTTASAVNYKNEETTGNGLLAIPQSLDANVKLLVTYTMTVDPDGTGSAPAVVTEITKPVTLNTQLASLEQNKVYTLNLSISANEILYSPDVIDWTPQGAEYAVPEV